MLQTCLTVYLWLAVRAVTSNRTLEQLLKLLRRPQSSKLIPRLSEQLERLNKTNLFYSTACFLADFHEAQCFFITAVSIALVYSNNQSASFNSAENWQSLGINQDHIQAITSAGALPLILTQLSLHRLGMDSIYSLVCSTTALIVTAVSVTQLKEFDATKVYDMFSDNKGLEECGGHPSLRTYCTTKWFRLGSRPMEMIFPWLSIIAILWCLKVFSLLSKKADQARSQQNDGDKSQTFFHRWSKLMYSFRNKKVRATTWGSVTKMTLNILLSVAQVVLMVFIIVQMVGLVKMQLEVSGAVDVEDSMWNVGQVIAVLVWAPVMARYLYTLFCELKLYIAFLVTLLTYHAFPLTVGVERGFSIRLIDEFVVVRDSSVTQKHSKRREEEVELHSNARQTPIINQEYSSLHDIDISNDGDSVHRRGISDNRHL